MSGGVRGPNRPTGTDDPKISAVDGSPAAAAPPATDEAPAAAAPLLKPKRPRSTGMDSAMLAARLNSQLTASAAPASDTVTDDWDVRGPQPKAPEPAAPAAPE